LGEERETLASLVYFAVQLRASASLRLKLQFGSGRRRETIQCAGRLDDRSR